MGQLTSPILLYLWYFKFPFPFFFLLVHPSRFILSDFSDYAAIFYFSPSGELFRFGYLCNTTELLLEPLNQLYKVGCYPDYYENLTFSAPKNQDAATILCQTNTTAPQEWGFTLGITWAIPCNTVPECVDGSDEFGCEFPTWLLPSLLSGAGSVLCITLFVHLHKSIKRTWKKKMQFQFRNSHLSTETEKLYKTAVLIESGNVDQIHKMYCQEVENHGGEGEAQCHLKVMGHLIKSLSKLLYNLTEAFLLDHSNWKLPAEAHSQLDNME